MANHFVFDGLEELKAELRDMPQELTTEASHIIEGEANGAFVAISSEYGRHRRSGNLQDHLKVEKRAAGRFGAAMVVKSTSRLAWLFDNGSHARHYITTGGKQHATGAMWGRTPPTHVFVRAMIKARRTMYEKLAALLERHGLRVSGQP